jgi:hypothetical protein
MPGSTRPPAAAPATSPPEGPAAAAERLLRLDMPIYGAPAEAVAERVRVPALFSPSPEPAAAPAAADGRTRQSSLLVMPVIRPGQFERLRELLESIGEAPSGEELVSNRVIPFRELKTVHFLRILVHPASPSEESPIPEWDGVLQASGEPIPPKLLFSTDFDGPLEEHLDELLRVAGHGLDVIFGHCEGWSGHQDRRGAHDFFLRNRVPTNTFYTGTMGRSVDQIYREAHLRERIQGFLDENAGKPDFATDAVRIRERVREWVFAQPDLQWTKVKPGPYPRLLLPQYFISRLGLTGGILLVAGAAAAVGVLNLFLPLGTAVAAVLLPLAALGAIGFAGYRYLGRLAASDPVIIGDVHQHTRRLVRTEDRIVQNEMSSVIYIKRPLWFRRPGAEGRAGVHQLLGPVPEQPGDAGGDPVHPLRPVGGGGRRQAAGVLQQLRRELGELPGRLHRQGARRAHCGVEQLRRLPAHGGPHRQGRHRRAALQGVLAAEPGAHAGVVQRLPLALRLQHQRQHPPAAGAVRRDDPGAGRGSGWRAHPRGSGSRTRGAPRPRREAAGGGGRRAGAGGAQLFAAAVRGVRAGDVRPWRGRRRPRLGGRPRRPGDPRLPEFRRR